MIVRALQSVVVHHPEHGIPVSVTEHEPRDTDDVLVRTYPWLFSADPPVESASARPGDRRLR